MSLRQSCWWSRSIAGYWLHVYRSVASADYGRRVLVLESDRSGRTWPLWSWQGR